MPTPSGVLPYNGDVRCLACVLMLALVLVVVPVRAQDFEEGGPINLTAEEQRWEGDVWRGLGSVLILYQDIKIQCDEMEYNRADPGPGGARQHHRRPGTEPNHRRRAVSTTWAQRPDLFINGSGFMPIPCTPSAGGEIEKLDETHFRIDGAKFTTCDRTIRVRRGASRIKRALLEEEGLGRFHSTAHQSSEHPVLLPALHGVAGQDASARRVADAQLRLLGSLGFNLGLPLYFPVGRSYDTTVFFDYYSEGFYRPRQRVALGAAGRRTGESPCSTRCGDQAPEPVAVAATTCSTPRTISSAFGCWRRSRICRTSTSSRTSTGPSNPTPDASLYSHVLMTRYLGILHPQPAHRSTDHLSDHNDVVLSQIPEVELRVRVQPARQLHASTGPYLLDELLRRRSRRRSEGDYGRADVFPTLSYTLPSPLWLSVTPRAGRPRHLLHRPLHRGSDGFVDESIDRTFCRRWSGHRRPVVFANLGQAARPLRQVQAPDGAAHRVPLSRTAPRTRIQIPVFDEVDSTRSTNRARWSLANRLLGRSKKGVSARELGSFELFQEYSFSEPLNQGPDGHHKPVEPARHAVPADPIAGTGIDAQATWDTLNKNPLDTSVAGLLQPPRAA